MCVRNKSDGPGLWARGRRRDAPSGGSRGGGSPAMAELGLPGVKKGKTWVGRHLRDMRNVLVVLWRWFGAPSGMLAEDGGSAAQGYEI